MKRNLFAVIALGAFAASAIPAAAIEDIRAPLSPSGGQSEAKHSGAFGSAIGGKPYSRSYNLTIPGDNAVYGSAVTFEDIRGPLSQSGSDQ